jgi:hypothetical protein
VALMMSPAFVTTSAKTLEWALDKAPRHFGNDQRTNDRRHGGRQKELRLRRGCESIARSRFARS